MLLSFLIDQVSPSNKQIEFPIPNSCHHWLFIFLVVSWQNKPRSRLTDGFLSRPNHSGFSFSNFTNVCRALAVGFGSSSTELHLYTWTNQISILLLSWKSYRVLLSALCFWKMAETPSPKINPSSGVISIVFENHVIDSKKLNGKHYASWSDSVELWFMVQGL